MRNLPNQRAESAYWPQAWIPAAILMAVLCVRLGEVLPIVPKLKPALISLVLVFPLLLAHAGASARTRAFKNRSVKLLLLYGAWGIVGVPFAIYKGGAFDAALLIPMGTVVVVALLLCAPTQVTMDRLSVAFMLMVTAMAAVSHLSGQMVAGRLTTAGSFDPNDLASIIAVTIPFALALAMRGTPKLRLLGLASITVLVVVLMGTGSRGGFVALLVGLLVLTAGLRMSRATVVIALVAIAAPTVWQTAPPVFKERIASLTNLESDYNMTEESGRKGTWTRGLGYALSHPITGVGLSNFSVAEGERLKSLGRVGAWHTAHNTYVQAFAELGFPGGLLLLALLGHSFGIARRMWRSQKLHRPEYLAALAAFCSAAFFLSHAYAYHLFAILGLIVHAGHVLATTENVSQPQARHGTQAPIAVHGRGTGTGYRGGYGRLVPEHASEQHPVGQTGKRADLRPALPTQIGGLRGGLTTAVHTGRMSPNPGLAT